MSLLWGMVILKPSSVRNASSACVRDGTSNTEYSGLWPVREKRRSWINGDIVCPMGCPMTAKRRSCILRLSFKNRKI